MVDGKPNHGLEFENLKVLTNEKRGGLRVVLFDRSPFKLFSLKFSLKFSMKKCVETARNRS
jgi:hypothetical protein